MSYDSLEISQRGGKPVELFRFTTGALVLFTYTNGDKSVTYLGELYSKEAIARSEIAQTGEDEEGSVEITMPRTNPVAQAFIAYGPEPPMALTIYRKHRTDPETVTVFAGEVSTVEFSGPSAKLTCLPLGEMLRRTVPKNTYQPQCNWALYSGQCGVARAAFRVNALVSLVSGDTIQATAFSSKPDGWFNNGYVERVDGTRRWIVNHVGATLTLMSAFQNLGVGEAVFAQAGCDRSRTTCKNKFSNQERFMGFPDIPTKNPFELGL